MNRQDSLRQEQQEQIKGIKKNSLNIRNELNNNRETISRNFENRIHDIELILDYMDNLQPELANGVPLNMATEAINRLKEVNGKLLGIINFDPMALDRPKDHASSVINDLVTYFEQTFNELQPLFNMYNYNIKFGDLKNANDKLNNILSTSKVKLDKIQSILDIAQSSSSKESIEKYSMLFKAEYKSYQNQSIQWLYGMWILSAIGITGVGLLIFFDPLKNLELISIIQFAGTKLFLISVFYILLSVVRRFYSASKHNAVINKHRACALETFEFLKESAKGDDTKDAILRQASNSIFSIQKSGYLFKEESIVPVNQVTEIFSKIPKT